MSMTPQVTEESKAPVTAEQPSTTVSTTDSAPKESKPFFTVYDDKAGEYHQLPQEVEEKTSVEAGKETPKEEVKPTETKVYAGKFKGEAELEKGYIELEKISTQRAQEAADLRKQIEATKVKTEAQVVGQPIDKKIETRVEETEFLDSLVADPKKAKESLKAEIMADLTNQMNTANEVRTILADWDQENPDLSTLQHVVNAEIQKILAADPSKAGNLKQLLHESTGNLRNWLGTIRQAGANEALTVRREVVPLAASGAATQGQPPSSSAPVQKSDADYLSEEIAARKRDYSRTRGEIRPTAR